MAHGKERADKKQCIKSYLNKTSSAKAKPKVWGGDYVKHLNNYLY